MLSDVVGWAPCDARSERNYSSRDKATISDPRVTTFFGNWLPMDGEIKVGGAAVRGKNRQI